MGRPRSLREENEFSSGIQQLKEKYPRTEDWWFSWDWRLARSPETDAVLVSGSSPPAYILKTDMFAEYGAPPPATFLYRFDENYVYMLDVKGS